MMEGITVRLYPPFSDLAGCRRLVLLAARPLLPGDLLRLLAEQCPSLRPHLREDGGHGGAIVLVSNSRLLGPEDRVQGGDEVDVCPAAWGG